MERFWTKVDVGLCWLWTGALHPDGYGRFWLDGGQNAHRVAWSLLVGPIPDGLELDHLCKQRACVNPDHLELVTHAENIRRGATGRYTPTKAVCPHGHSYEEDNNVYHWRGKRYCRTCRSQRSALRWRREHSGD